MKILSADKIPNIEQIINSRICRSCSSILSPAAKIDTCSSACKKAEIALCEEPEIICRSCKEKKYPINSVPEKCERCGALLSPPVITCPYCGRRQFKVENSRCINCDSELLLSCPLCEKEQIFFPEQKFCVHCGIPWKQKCPCPSCGEIIKLQERGRADCVKNCSFRICSECFRAYPWSIMTCRNKYCREKEVFWTEVASGGNNSWENIGGEISYSNNIETPPYFSNVKLLWRYSFPGQKLFPPLNKSGVLIVPTKGNDVLFFAENGTDMTLLNGTGGGNVSFMLLNSIDLGAQITSSPFIKDNTVYFGLSSGTIKTVKLDLWEQRVFASGLSEIVFTGLYKEKVFVVNRMGDLIVFDLKGERLFVHHISLPSEGLFLSSLPLLFDNNSVYYIYTYSIHNRFKSAILLFDLSIGEGHIIKRTEEVINQALLYDKTLFLAMRNELLIINSDSSETVSLKLGSSIVSPMSLNSKQERIFYNHGNLIESCKFDGNAKVRRATLEREDNTVVTAPLIFDMKIFYADKSFLYLNGETISNLDGIPAPYFSYSNNKIFITTERGAIYAFKLV